jgi:uncharacterized protein DUF4328
VDATPGPVPAYGSVVPHRHLGGWTIATAIALGLVALQLALLAEWVARDAETQTDVREQVFVARSDLAFNHARLVLLTKSVLLFTLVAALLWLVWQYQAHANLRALRPASFHPGAAIVAWLVPGLNIALALIAMGELWLGSDPQSREGERGRRLITPNLWLWWASLCTAATLIVLGLLRTPRSGSGAEQLIARDHLLLPGCLAGTAAAVLGIILVVRIEGRLQLKEDAAGHPAWQAWSDRQENRGDSTPLHEEAD